MSARGWAVAWALLVCATAGCGSPAIITCRSTAKRAGPETFSAVAILKSVTSETHSFGGQVSQFALDLPAGANGDLTVEISAEDASGCTIAYGQTEDTLHAGDTLDLVVNLRSVARSCGQ